MISHPYPRRGRSGPLTIALLALALAACGGIELADLETPRPVPPGSCLVVGLLGGLDAWDDASKGVRQMALELRDPDRDVWAETFENRRVGVALDFVRRALDGDGDGAVDGAESRRARVVVYGQSLGGGAAVALARELGEQGIGVRLLLLVDSVGWNDAVVPPNVAAAANLYQDDGLLIAGEHPLRAANPAATGPLLEREFDYDRPPGSEISISDLPWHKTAFRAAHARMDRDPRVWRTARRLIEGACEADPGDER